MSEVIIKTLKEKFFELAKKEAELKKPNPKLSQQVDEICEEIRRLEGNHVKPGGTSIGVDGEPRSKKRGRKLQEKPDGSDKDSVDA